MKWIRVTTTENIPLREGRCVQIGDEEIAIFNLGDRFVAVDNACPHRGGPLCDGDRLGQYRDMPTARLQDLARNRPCREARSPGEGRRLPRASGGRRRS